MRLKNVKLVGFKSFVDPTTVKFPSNRVAIVGPNGCGKSNIIDAVRWVMGESSAKNLRGESMVDVIFNGSTGRKPVGQASVELFFDNSDGGLGGEYASYAEIAIRRIVTRDGQSQYFLNGIRCRRRDITGIFMGTGMGPRSYAIIAQDTISRLIEAKPEQLRVYLEEAAGISKYKERRRETENRIRHTRDNLDRLNDIREELERQLNHLQRQAKAAERYKVLKEEERLLKAQLYALRWQSLQQQMEDLDKTIREHEVKLEAYVAEQRRLDAEIEQQRQIAIELRDEFNKVQEHYYSAGSEIARLEQTIAHSKERQQQLQTDLQQTQEAGAEAQEHLSSDENKINSLQEELSIIEPDSQAANEQMERLQEALFDAEQSQAEWQSQWENFSQQASETAQKAQVEQARIQQLEQRIQTLSQRIERVEEEHGQLDEVADREQMEGLQQQLNQQQEEKQAQHERLQEASQAIEQQRQQLQNQRSLLDDAKNQLRTFSGRHASLEALQQAALGQCDEKVMQWLQANDLKQQPRLAQQIEVEPGWEQAVETVLGNYLQAVCVDGVDEVAHLLPDLQQGEVALLDGNRPTVNVMTTSYTRLTDKITSAFVLEGLVGQVYVVDELNQALAMRSQLSAQESVITKDGIWLGANWLRVTRDVDAQAGVIAREKELKSLQHEIREQEEIIEHGKQQVQHLQDKLADLELEKDSTQRKVAQSVARHADTGAQLRVIQERIEHISQRKQKLQVDLNEQKESRVDLQDNLQNARHIWQQAMTSMEQDANKREILRQQRDQQQQELEQARNRANEQRQSAQELNVRVESVRTQLVAIQENMSRAQKQVQEMQQRSERLQASLAELAEPLTQNEAELEKVLEKRLEIEALLNQARQKVEAVEETLRKLEKQRHTVEEETTVWRQQGEDQRMKRQSIEVRSSTLQEQLAETDYKIENLLAEMPEQANEKQWEEDLECTVTRIQRLGNINLAAIDEYEVQSERKTYLDKQNADLELALETLEGAISKIDQETRLRFKETYDLVNEKFKTLFPKIFSGGSAYLELIGEDLLDTGVRVMAQPPGKRNASISMLSGGEKALTAVALVFGIFELNPAPFCMLDEVDAPLDEANVRRFGNLVKEMSEKLQIIFISHNKTTIEIAEQLCGVTMNEPGVSRLVSVDIDEAMAMAEKA